ncbi:MAG TPA: anthranilate phosphoribosyltransferase [Gammaproteobacteria bacterium]|nr:anthranilate phosphoribosyltransferase [Gammaproteobacteria bacterium]
MPTDASGAAAGKLLDRLLTGESLAESEADTLLCELAAGTLAPALAGALLTALRAKGESAEEIRGFAKAMRRLARRPEIAPGRRHVDIVGTGGDGSGSLNLSTGSALLAAAAGATVVKHGNRSVSSRSGSADVLAALGMPVPLDERDAARYLRELGFTFLFAPHYHPAMKHIGPVRAALGVRTVFNILGPLANPAAPPYHVIGAFSEAMAALMAETLAGMDIERAFVVHGADGWDEATPVGPFVCFDVRPGSVRRSVRDPADYGVARCGAEPLRGGDATENARRLEAALRGEDEPGHRDALVLGAALALEVTGDARDAAAGVERARAAIESGAAARTLARLAELGRGGAA